ncbi:hypothetical protein CDAR_602991 [Caerostris darwini]|uniref:Uncharacterized protein n=1 Tax=Caerostris darwini TaxID=1538125 RepID=A0AAV4TFV5_9ARAC|nr:hypothetical protein CDAR_602991 [Caerostris darwini]
MYTWQSSDRLTFMDRRDCSNLMDARGYRCANVDANHMLVMSKVKYVAKLKDPDIQRFTARKQNRNQYYVSWHSVKEILRSALETLSRNDWFDTECKEATKIKNKAYRMMLQKQDIRKVEVNYKKTFQEKIIKTWNNQ